MGKDMITKIYNLTLQDVNKIKSFKGKITNIEDSKIIMKEGTFQCRSHHLMTLHYEFGTYNPPKRCVYCNSKEIDLTDPQYTDIQLIKIKDFPKGRKTLPCFLQGEIIPEDQLGSIIIINGLLVNGAKKLFKKNGSFNVKFKLYVENFVIM